MRPAFDPARDREHARLLLMPILERAGCDVAPLDAVLDALVDQQRLDGPACVHWTLGQHAALGLGRCPLDLWRDGHADRVVSLASRGVSANAASSGR